MLTSKDDPFEESVASSHFRSFLRTHLGEVVLGDSLSAMRAMRPKSVNLVMTSPPFGLVRKKDYGNADAAEYVEWFRPFGEAVRRILAENGSFVIDIGGAWNKGQPTRSLYHFKLLIMLCDELGFHLAQEFHWWNPSKLPSPAEWVNIRRVRVKDAVNSVWWLSPTPWPKASNRRVLQPYSPAMLELLERGYKAKKRPSGHDISSNFSTDNGAAIPPNLLAIANTDSNSHYQRYCKENNLPIHPARYPAELPEFFIRMLTDERDWVVDPFAGSCITGEVCERLGRRWKCVELDEQYVKGAQARFIKPPVDTYQAELEISVGRREPEEDDYYRIPHPALLWNGTPRDRLQTDGGLRRPPSAASKSAE
ncbi:MAG: DNA-methyltransferase [Gemmatimonadaceae bacterium]